MASDDHDAMHQGRHEADSYRRIELITGVRRRRHWTRAEKAEIVAASLRPGVNVSDVARHYGVNRGLLQTWRRRAEQQEPEFVPLRVTTEGMPPTMETERSLIEIEAHGIRVRIVGPIDPAALRVVLTQLGRRG